jgi:hypothetical protein
VPTQEKRVAVIAIHGVGHHESGATAQAVTDLLAGVETGSIAHPRNRYTPFSLDEIQIPLPPAENPFHEVDPFHRRDQESAKGKFTIGSMFDERRGEFQTYYEWNEWFGRVDESGRHLQERQKAALDLDIATEFMNVQLKDFKGDKTQNSYTTWRHCGRRLGQDRTPEKEVHVYEMYWADLARPNNSLVRFLFSFYQLLLHLISLGRMAIDHASFENLGKLDWFVYLRSYTYATRVLSLAVVPLLVLIYGVALAPLPLLLTGTGTRALVSGSLLILVGVLGVLLGSLKSKPLPGLKSWWALLIPSTLPGAALLWILMTHPALGPFVLVVEWWIVGALVSFWIFLKYDQVRNGAKQAGAVFIGLVTFAFFAILVSRGAMDEIALKTTSILLVQYVFLVLRFLIVTFILLTLFSFLTECVCLLRLRMQKKQAELARARSAIRTARFAMAIPALLILLLAVFTGSGAYKFVNSYGDVYKEADVEVIPMPHSLKWIVLDPDETRSLLRAVRESSGRPVKPSEELALQQSMPLHSAHKILEGLIVQSAPPGMIVTISIAGAGFLFLGLIVLPSVYYEIWPERNAPNGPARNLGNWLTAGFHNFKWSVALLWIAIFVVPIAFIGYGIWAYLHDPAVHESFLLYFYTMPWMIKGEAQLLQAGALIAGSAVVIAGLLVKNLSAVLDTILDVDTYLRTLPIDATPRAKIAERYVSLLRHLHTCQEADGSRSYDHIVIVAHSLGSLITADLLRYLHSGCMPGAAKFAFAGPETEALPIYFFSMGCPLRQLLNRFFPHLYQWISETPEDSGGNAEAQENNSHIHDGAHPQPVQLHLRQWVNFYRSGDYVGRGVWTKDLFGRTIGKDAEGAFPDPTEPSISHDGAAVASADRVDACIGLGAHTHYWDRTAPDVSYELDRLIAL